MAGLSGLSIEHRSLRSVSLPRTYTTRWREMSIGVYGVADNKKRAAAVSAFGDRLWPDFVRFGTKGSTLYKYIMGEVVVSLTTISY